MAVPTSPPEKIVEQHVVDRLEYHLDDEGKVHVQGVPGIGDRVLFALRAKGYDIVLRPGYYVRRD